MYDTNQLADLLGLSPVTLQRWRADGTGPDWIKVGSKAVRYTNQAVEDWLRVQERSR